MAGTRGIRSLTLAVVVALSSWAWIASPCAAQPPRGVVSAYGGVGWYDSLPPLLGGIAAVHLGTRLFDGAWTFGARATYWTDQRYGELTLGPYVEYDLMDIVWASTGYDDQDGWRRLQLGFGAYGALVMENRFTGCNYCDFLVRFSVELFGEIRVRVFDQLSIGIRVSAPPQIRTRPLAVQIGFSWLF